MQISSIQILDKRNNRVIEAELLCELTLGQIAESEKEYDAYRRSRSLGQEGGAPPENDFWNWVAKKLSPDGERSRFFGVRHQEQMQGLMQLNLQPCLSKATEGQDSLYVEYIETAPWNQFAYAGADVRYGGVGVALIRTAIQASAEAGHEGRIALHSKKQSEIFYRRLGFADLGTDPDAEDLRYFELSEQNARELLHGGRP